jgi:MFS family permease
MPAPFALYRVNYFAQALFITFIGMYFTLFLLENTPLTRPEIAGLLLLIQLPLLSRPLIGRIADRSVHLRLIISTGILLFIGSMSSLAVFYSHLAPNGLIGLFFGAYLGLALFDAGVDSLMVQRERTHSAAAAMNVHIVQAGGGVLLSMVFLLAIGTDLQSTGWHFLMGTVALGPILVLLQIRKFTFPTPAIEIPQLSVPLFPSNPPSSPPKRSIVFLILFTIGMNVAKLGDYPLEPYFVDRFGAPGFAAYVATVSAALILGLGIFVIIGKYSAHFIRWRIRYLVVAGIYAVGYWLVVAFGSLPLLLIATLVSGIFGHLLGFCYLTLFMDCTPPHAAGMTYQLYSTTYLIASIGFGSLGLVLDAVLGAQTVFVLVAGLLFVNILFLPFIRPEKFSLKQRS